MAETAKGSVDVTEPTRAQVAVARRMAESKATAPDTALAVEADVSEVAGDLLAAIVHASATALREHPQVNGAYRDAKFERYERINVGVAVWAHDAWVAPVVLDADAKSAQAIAVELGELAERARAGTLTAGETSGTTFTVVAVDARRVVPVLASPQAAILGVGAAEDRAVVRDGAVVARRVVELTLVSDHRILYGPPAVAFLRSIVDALA